MRTKFDISQPVIIVPVTVEANGKSSDFEFVVGTGSADILISENAMKAMGYTPADSIEEVPMRNGIAYRYIINSITALGITRRNIKVLSYKMPSGSGANGLLGLDFFENTRLTINLKKGEIMVEEKE